MTDEPTPESFLELSSTYRGMALREPDKAEEFNDVAEGLEEMAEELAETEGAK